MDANNLVVVQQKKYIYLMGCKQFGADPTKEIKNNDCCMCREERGKVKEYKIIIVYVSCGRKVK